MVSQKAAAKSPDYSDNKITLVAEAVKGDAATVNTWVSSTKANDKELVFAGEGLFAITETLDPAKLQFSYDDFEFVENLYSSVFVLSADSSLNLKNLDDLEPMSRQATPYPWPLTALPAPRLSWQRLCSALWVPATS